MFVIIDDGLVECINQFGGVPSDINYLLLGLFTTPFEMYGAGRGSKVHYQVPYPCQRQKQTNTKKRNNTKKSSEEEEGASEATSAHSLTITHAVIDPKQTHTPDIRQ